MMDEPIKNTNNFTLHSDTAFEDQISVEKAILFAFFLLALDIVFLL